MEKKAHKNSIYLKYIYIFYNIINVFTITFDTFSVCLLNKIITFLFSLFKSYLS